MMPSLSGLLYYLKTVFDGTNDPRKSDIWLYLSGMSEEKCQVLDIRYFGCVVLSNTMFDGTKDPRNSDIWLYLGRM